MWLGCREAPETVTFTVYAAGAVVLGMFKDLVSARTVFAVIASGSDGVTAHCAPAIALASQLVLTVPLVVGG